MSQYSQEELKRHHDRCSGNRGALAISKLAGCFHCQEIFPAKAVIAFVSDGDDAYCPKCSIDSVIVDDGINEFTPELLSALRHRYFEEPHDWSAVLNNPTRQAEIEEFRKLFEEAVRSAELEETPPQSGEAAS